MVQNPLWETSDNVYPNFVRVEDDLGPVGKGASGARYVSAENGTEYLIKGPSLKLKSTGHPEHPHVAANELIAAGLARLLGLPTLDSRIVEMRGQLFFASVWMPAGTFYDPITAELFNGCANRDRTYGLVVFDAWLCNTDRHGGNLLVRRAGIPDNGGERLSLLLNDHSHCLVLPGKTVEALVARLDS